VAKQSKNTLYNWFKKGLKPLETQFRDWMDSYVHKDETIPMASVDGLVNALNSIPSDFAIEALEASKEDKSNKGVANGYASLDADGKVPASQISKTTTINQPAHGFSLFDPVRVAASGGYEKFVPKDNIGIGNNCVGLVVKVIDVNNFKLAGRGNCTVDDLDTIAVPGYVHALNAEGQGLPYTIPFVEFILFTVISATEIHVHLEHARYSGIQGAPWIEPIMPTIGANSCVAIGAGGFELYNGSNKYAGILVAKGGVKFLHTGGTIKASWIVANTEYYAQTDGSISTVVSDRKVILGVSNGVGLMIHENKSELNAKLNLGTNTSLENLDDASDVFAIAALSRLGVVFRSEFLKWNETLKQLTIIGSQAIWRAYDSVTNGNMGIKVLEEASEAFKIFDDIGNYISVGVESGKRFFRVFTNLRLYNGVSYSEAEFKSVECFASVTTEIKSITIPTNCQLTIEITGINVQNVDKNTIFGHAQFHFKNDGGTVTDLSQDKLRYEFQYSTIKGTDGYVINTDTRIDASITDQTVSINFVNTVAKHTITQCEIKYSITTLPEAP